MNTADKDAMPTLPQTDMSAAETARAGGERRALIYALDRYLRQDETAGDTDNNVYRDGVKAMSAALSAPPAPVAAIDAGGQDVVAALRITRGHVLHNSLNATQQWMRVQAIHDLVAIDVALAACAVAPPVAAVAQPSQAYMCHETETSCRRCTTVCEATAPVVGIADEQIAALKAQFGVTSNGRGIREFTQVKAFALAVVALAASPAAVAQPVAGWKLVPVEPTREMVKAAFSWSDAPTSAYKAMLAASPIAPQAGQAGEEKAK